MRINADSVTDGRKYNSEHEVPAERHICVQTASQMERSTTANTRYPECGMGTQADSELKPRAGLWTLEGLRLWTLDSESANLKLG